MINIKRFQFKRIIFTIVMICTVAQSSSQAASFDCSKASKPIEKEICRDKNLSDLDEKLAQAFSNSITQLSPSAHKKLTISQAKWVEYYSAYCKNNDDKSKKISSAMDTKCLANAYSERIKDLKATGKEIYGYKTYRVFDGTVRFTKDYLGGSPSPMNANITMAIYPQIDDTSPFGDKVNAFLSGSARENTTENEDPDLTGLEQFISTAHQLTDDWVSLKEAAETMGGPYPNDYTTCGIFSKSLGRKLLIKDIFTSPKWQAAAISFAKQHFKNMAKKNNEFRIDMVLNYEPLEVKLTDTFNYCLNESGFDVFGFFVHAVASFDGVKIPWKVVEPYLTAEAKSQIVKFRTIDPTH
jgi:uncharacterized protein